VPSGSLKRKRAPTEDEYPGSTTYNSATTQEEKVYEHPPPQNLGQVFDRHMSSMIERVLVMTDSGPSNRAAVTMVFPSWASVDCVMSFEVDARRIAQLAMALFNVRVEIVENIRYIDMRGGVRLQPHSGIRLQGVLEDAIIEIFGPEIHGAIKACRMREVEVEAGNPATDCVSMLFNDNPGEVATLNLALGMKEGTQIRKKLYTRI